MKILFCSAGRRAELLKDFRNSMGADRPLYHSLHLRRDGLRTVYARGIHGHDHDVSRVILRAVQRHVYAAEHDPRDRHLRVADEARSEAAERRVKK